MLSVQERRLHLGVQSYVGQPAVPNAAQPGTDPKRAAHYTNLQLCGYSLWLPLQSEHNLHLTYQACAAHFPTVILTMQCAVFLNG